MKAFFLCRLKVSVLSGPNWNLEVLIFERGGKLEYSKDPSEQKREPTTNSTYIIMAVDAGI